jgi:conjugative transfer signal peptidase TraF
MTPAALSHDGPKPDGPRWRLLAAVILLTGLVVSTAAVAGGSFTWNLSPSMPRGLYFLERGTPSERGSIVLVPVPESVRPIALGRGYLPFGAKLLKIVVALPGDFACVRDNSLIINGVVLGSVLSRDSHGLPLAPARFCGELPPGKAFVATSAPLSFDSRYFGTVPLSTLTVVRPLWTF